MTLRIRKYGDPVLETNCAPVAEFGTPEELKKLVDDMFETMYAHKGVGLAAPQVGVAKRLTVIDVGGEDPEAKLVLINPEILEKRGQAGGRGRVPEHPGFPGGRGAGDARAGAGAGRGGQEFFETTGKNCWRGRCSTRRII
jgi:peptide deformylase